MQRRLNQLGGTRTEQLDSKIGIGFESQALRVVERMTSATAGATSPSGKRRVTITVTVRACAARLSALPVAEGVQVGNILHELVQN